MNYLSNTQWISRTGLPPVNKPDMNGALMPPIQVNSTTTGSTITCYSSSTGFLKDGDLVLAQSGFVSPYFKLCSFEVSNVVPNVSFQITFPLWTSIAIPDKGVFLPITSGDLGSTSGGGPDGWSKTPGLKMYVDDFTQNASTSQYYQIALNKGADTDETFYHAMKPAMCRKFGGLAVSFSAEALIKSGSARLFIMANGIVLKSSDFSTGNFDRTMVSMTLPPVLTSMSVGVEFSGSTGNLMYLSKPSLVIGSDRGWVPNVNEYISPVVKISPLSYVGAALKFQNVAKNTTTNDYGWSINVHAETNGSLGKGIKALDLQLEARCDTPNSAIGTRNQQPVPVVYGTTGYCKVATQMEIQQGLVKLANDRFYMYSPSQNPWYNASIDINSVITW